MESLPVHKGLESDVALAAANRPGNLRHRVAAMTPSGAAGAEFRRFATQGDLPALALTYANPDWGLPEYEEQPPEIDIIERLCAGPCRVLRTRRRLPCPFQRHNA